jgi:hypothetical protein
MVYFSYREREGVRISRKGESIELIVNEIKDSKYGRAADLKIRGIVGLDSLWILADTFYWVKDDLRIKLFKPKKRGKRVIIQYDLDRDYKIEKIGRNFIENIGKDNLLQKVIEYKKR